MYGHEYQCSMLDQLIHKQTDSTENPGAYSLCHAHMHIIEPIAFIPRPPKINVCNFFDLSLFLVLVAFVVWS